MCLIAFAINASPSWALVVASNRDEFLDRPTQPLSMWKTASGHEIISGRDLRAGGTWLGVTPGGRVAFLTNVHGPECKHALISRGELVTRWLESSSSSEEFLTQLQKTSADYSGFNLVVGDLSQNAWTWMTNRSTTSASGWSVQALSAGVYGLSNASLDTPWPKTVELKRVLATALLQEETSCELQLPLWVALASQTLIQPTQYRETTVPGTRAPDFLNAFVNFPDSKYGTRSSTLLMVGKQENQSLPGHRQMEIHERTYFRESCESFDEIAMPYQSEAVIV